MAVKVISVLLQNVTLSTKLEANWITGTACSTISIGFESKEQPAALNVLTVIFSPLDKELFVNEVTVEEAPSDTPPAKNW